MLWDSDVNRSNVQPLLSHDALNGVTTKSMKDTGGSLRSHNFLSSLGGIRATPHQYHKIN